MAFLYMTCGFIFAHIAKQAIIGIMAHNINIHPFAVRYKEPEKPTFPTKVPTEVPPPSRPAPPAPPSPPPPPPEQTPEALIDCKSIVDTDLCREYLPRCVVRHYGIGRRGGPGHNFVCFPLQGLCVKHYRSDNLDDFVQVCP